MIAPEKVSRFLLILAAILIIAAILIKTATPSFYKLNQRLKKLDAEIGKRKCYINMANVKYQIDLQFKLGKLDGLEREYLLNRTQIIEDKCNLQKKPKAPRYAAGSPEDNIRYHH